MYVLNLWEYPTKAFLFDPWRHTLLIPIHVLSCLFSVEISEGYKLPSKASTRYPANQTNVLNVS